MFIFKISDVQMIFSNEITPENYLCLTITPWYKKVFQHRITVYNKLNVRFGTAIHCQIFMTNQI